MVTDKLRPEEIQEAIALVPLLAAYFQRTRAEMPAELRDAFADHRLTARHGAVLSQLRADRVITVTELAGRMGLSLPTVSELVGDLDRAGWVVRREDPANRRRTLISLPERRRPAVEEFVATRAAPVVRALEGLSARDRRGFVEGLRAWAAAVQDGQR